MSDPASSRRTSQAKNGPISLVSAHIRGDYSFWAGDDVLPTLQTIDRCVGPAEPGFMLAEAHNLFNKLSYLRHRRRDGSYLRYYTHLASATTSDGHEHKVSPLWTHESRSFHSRLCSG